MIRTRPSVKRSPASTAATPRRTASRSGSGSPRPRADRVIRSRWRSIAKTLPSTTLTTSNTPSPTVSPWSRAATAGRVRIGQQLAVHPGAHASKLPRRPRSNWWCPRASAMVLFASPGRGSGAGSQADVAQLVERNLAKVEVASSSLVVRSERVSRPIQRWVGREARQRTANPCTRVQIPYPPRQHHTLTRAIGAAVARFPDTEEVTGSNPVSPTSNTAGQRPVSRNGTGLVPSHVPNTDRGEVQAIRI